MKLSPLSVTVLSLGQGDYLSFLREISNCESLKERKIVKLMLMCKRQIAYPFWIQGRLEQVPGGEENYPG